QPLVRTDVTDSSEGISGQLHINCQKCPRGSQGTMVGGNCSRSSLLARANSKRSNFDWTFPMSKSRLPLFRGRPLNSFLPTVGCRSKTYHGAVSFSASASISVIEEKNGRFLWDNGQLNSIAETYSFMLTRAVRSAAASLALRFCRHWRFRFALLLPRLLRQSLLHLAENPANV